MKKIKSIFIKMKSKLTLKTYQKPLYITIISLLLINLVVLIIGSIVGLIIDPEYFNYNFFKAFTHALSCMISANTITKLIDIIDTNMEVVILSAIIIAIEMVLFSGAIIATLTSAIRSFIDKKSKAKGKIELENHFVILNWNSKVPDMIFNLIEKNYSNNVIILSEKDKDYVNTEIESVISAYSSDSNLSNSKKKKIKLIAKEGNPLLHGNLEDISIEKASNIVIMSREDMTRGEDINISNSDLYSLKIMLALGNFKINKDCNIVIETDTEETKEKIEDLSITLNNLKNKSIIPISFNKKIGQIIASTILNPAMASIYLELLSYEGCEFYSYGTEEVDNYLSTHNNAIPIIKFERLFVLADDEADLGLKRNKSLVVERRLKVKENIDLSYNYTIFVIGENKKSEFIIENLNLATIGYGTNFKVLTYQKNDIDKLIDDIKNTTGPRKVLILSDDKVSSDSYDANVFVTLIALHSTFPDRKQLDFVTELLDSKNLNSVKDFNIKNAIISNRMMSLLLTQLALNKDSKKFFDGLLTTDTEEGGDYFDINIKKVSDMLDIDSKVVFNNRAELIQSFYYSFEKKYMLIGLIRNGVIEFIPKNQDENVKIELDKEDSFIFIKY